VAQFQQRHAASSAGQRQQLATVNRELREASGAIDRYLTAFEKAPSMTTIPRSANG
jgi:hypothetical protein